MLTNTQNKILKFKTPAELTRQSTSSFQLSSMANVLINRRTRRAVKPENAKWKRSDSKSNTSSENSNFSCKKHTKHRQSPGICSLCLTERLSNSKLSLNYYDYTKKTDQASGYCGSSASSSSSSVSSCYSSSSVSSCSSPLQYRFRSEKKKDGKKQSFLFRLLLGSIVD
ncbi:uncharacterized protein LOC17896394 [Capsella rubella]|nr:uncharacterized protein LOC17896394 [Capsella rubella]